VNKTRLIILLLFLCIFLILTTSCIYADNPSNSQINNRDIFHPSGSFRTQFTINECWTFRYFSIDTNEPANSDFKDSEWDKINLPHTWNANNVKGGRTGYRQGIGWYRKKIYLNNSLKGRKIFLHFEGANQKCDVYVNGKKVGEHIGGYTAFTFDITNLLIFDEKENLNIIAVKVDNRFNKNSPPLSADFTFYGGIYRDVWLIATNPIHVTLDDYGSSGILINTPVVTNEKAIVRIRGKVVNETEYSKNLIALSTVVDETGQKISEMKSEVFVNAKNEKIFTQLSNPIIKPKLWSPESPILYAVYTEIYDSDQSVDIVKSTLGFRWFSFDPNDGFSLNGKRVRLTGTNRHQDYPGMGNALQNEQHENDLRIIKNTGFNFLRLAHYPQDPAVLETADKIGLVIWEEIPVVNYTTVTDEFVNNCKNMLREMIYQHYNHPSIMMWGYMNEIFLRDSNGEREKYFPEKYTNWTVNLAQSLENIICKEDPDRVTVMAIHKSDIYNETKIAMIPEVLGYNLYFGWYSGNVSSFGKFLDQEHKSYPDRCIVVSEYGAGSDIRLHSKNPKRFDFTTEYQQYFHEQHLPQILERPYLNASAAWNQFDFGSAKRGDSKPGINQKGLLNFDRKPKDIYYYYKAQLSKEPVIHIASHDWKSRYCKVIIRSEKRGISVSNPVKVYTNLQKVELFINGESLKKKKTGDSGIVVWDVPFIEGLNILEAHGKRSGVLYSDKVEIDNKMYIEDLRTSKIYFNELAVNVGAASQFIDNNGIVWNPDQPYKNGSWGYICGKKQKTSLDVIGTYEDPVFQTCREGVESYKFDTPDGEYEVELLMLEYLCQKCNERKTDIQINGHNIFGGLDLVKEFGYLNGVKRKFKIYVNNGQGITINFFPIKGESIISGIYLRNMAVKN